MYGNHARTLDDRSRIILPAKLREDISSSKVYLTLNNDGEFNFAEIRDQNTFERWLNDLVEQNSYDKSTRMLRRLWLGRTTEVELDSQGRILIPKQYISQLAIQKDVTLLGVGEFIELWATQQYEQYENSLTPEAINQATEKLAKGAY